MLTMENSNLSKVQDVVVKRKANLRTAEQKVQKLKEQLSVAERIVNANKQQVDRLNNQVSTKIMVYSYSRLSLLIRLDLLTGCSHSCTSFNPCE